MSEPPRLIVLTPRQRAVLGHLTWDGADNRTIAARMGLTEHTIKSHMKIILAAFDAESRTAIVADCLRGRVTIRTRKQPNRTRTEETT